jgi:hypothetical protein
MTRLTIILLILFCSCSKYTKLDGTYYSKSQDCFIIDDKEGVIENKDDYIIDRLILKQKNFKLKFYSKSNVFLKRLLNIKDSKYKFRVLYKTEDSFMVSPKSKMAIKYFNKRDSIVFKTKYKFEDRTNYFTKIIYHSSHCFGCCKDLQLELDYSGNLKVTDKGSGWMSGCRDSLLNDNFYGKVSYEDLERLKVILSHSQLKTLEWPKRNCFDAPDITLILYQNDKRFYFKENQPCIPIISWELSNYLRRLFHYASLKKVEKNWEYEQ